MTQVLNLALPFFGLILLGFIVAKWRRIPREGLAWMNVFIVYVALPALFFQLLSRTPVEDLASFGYIFATTLGTYLAFVVSFATGRAMKGGTIAVATIRGFSGAYGNIGYMGPGLALAAFGEEAVVPVALVFCFDNTMHFVLAPLLMAVGGRSERTGWSLVADVFRKVLFHPFILATVAGVGAAIVAFEPPEVAERLLEFLAGAAAPCALFAMGVTVATAPSLSLPSVTWLLAAIKLVIHPVLVWLLLGWVGSFDPVWVYSAVLLAALPSATNVFVIAQQYETWIEEASSMVVLTTLLSVISVTGLLYAITTGLLPADPFP